MSSKRGASSLLLAVAAPKRARAAAAYADEYEGDEGDVDARPPPALPPVAVAAAGGGAARWEPLVPRFRWLRESLTAAGCEDGEGTHKSHKSHQPTARSICAA